MADRVVRGALAYKTLLIWPYAVAPAIAGVLWAFLFAPSIGIVTYVLKGWGIDWNWIINGDQAMLLIVIASVWKQISYNFLFFLAGLQSIPRSLAKAGAIDRAAAGGRSPRRAPARRRRPPARARRAASGRSSFRCFRRPPSSCWWSTSSTPS